MPIQGIISKARVPVKIWAPIEEVEPAAIEQLTNTANLPFVFKHVAAMSDVHLGKGATIGSVIATKGAISPSAVGVDLGCGMAAIKPKLTEDERNKLLQNLQQLRHSIERSVPVAHNGNSRITESVEGWLGWEGQHTSLMSDSSILKKAKSQLGSLGGGNHFIEVCLDTEQNIWVMLHSGSRNIGKVLAERHIDTAKGIMKKLFIDLPDPDLAYLAEGTPEFLAYMADLKWCQYYALQNRVEMLSRVMKDISFLLYGENRPIESIMGVNCHHNYVSRENHYGENVLVTRKGAVRARKDDLGIIPGSMGTRSYIVRGLGNPESFHSCSHGAGRKMSRTQARKLFTVEDMKKQTQGVECRKDDGVIDEIPSAYKDIEKVMKNQSDLVEVVAELKQVLCVKG